MAKTSQPKATALGKQSDENTGPTLPAPQPLSQEDRDALRKIFADPVYRKAFSNARLMKPSAFAGQVALNGELGGQIANNRLHQIQGWEMFEAALAKQLVEVAPRREAPQEFTSPDPFLQPNKP